MTAAEDAIRARRRLTNKLIASHEAGRLRPFFAADARLIAGDGGLILGAEQIVAAFDGQFRDPDFIDYVRTPATVEVDAAGERAAETGRWMAHWKSGEMSGSYMACWRRQTGQWVIESELFVTLGS
ncbi:nuclear transport factor 2 family protein [Phenylobacterium sp.]|jgi:ketosteroid isomerase-like protein|uniref:YybH family protein n=1 Tax=Phenylobacterium sp. TaxID=1871053 RepID=UPI002F9595E9